MEFICVSYTVTFDKKKTRAFTINVSGDLVRLKKCSALKVLRAQFDF